MFSLSLAFYSISGIDTDIEVPACCTRLGKTTLAESVFFEITCYAIYNRLQRMLFSASRRLSILDSSVSVISCCFLINLIVSQVRMTAETMPDVPYILFLSICAHPASHRETNDEFAYKCRLPELRDQGLDLPEAPACEDDRQVFNYEFKGGSGSEFRLPEGTGLPVGPGTALEQMVGFVRFPVTGDNRTIAGPVLEVGLVAPSDDTIPISALVLESYGFVDRMSVASVSGSWTLEQEMRMHLRLLHLHTHETAIDVVVWIETTSGGKEVVLRQNPRSFSGVVDVSDSSSAVLRHGDRLVVQCTFNNTKEHKLRVE